MWWPRPNLHAVLLEIFCWANLSFLGVDILLAHGSNHFAHPGEWIPVGFSAIVAVVLGVGLLTSLSAPLQGFRWGLGLAAGAASIAVGTVGMMLHLESQFFQAGTLKSLVYAAPFVAPLSYAGVGFLLIMNRMVHPDATEWARWTLIFTHGGFVGNFVLSLADHAQNGFYHATEWIPVVSSAFAVGFLTMLVWRPHDSALHLGALIVLLIQFAVGTLGFLLHFAADWTGSAESVFANFLYGAPIFAPLLFNNLALLGLLGLSHLRLYENGGERTGPSATRPGHQNATEA